MRPDNVRAAVDAVVPLGIEVCSGGRTDGRLDPAKLAALAAAVGGAPRRAVDAASPVARRVVPG